MVKTFHTGDLVSVATGYPMPPNAIMGIYALLNHLTGADLMQHQVPLAAQRMRPYLLAQHPWLVGLEPSKSNDPAVLEKWLATVSAVHGEQHEVVAPPSSVWGEHDPIADFRKLNPVGRIIPVMLPPDDDRG